MKTTLERAFDRRGIKNQYRADAEKFLLKEFIRRAHHYIENPPPHSHEVDELEWLTLMQHYRAPTRLLDWTYSLYFSVFMVLDSLSFERPKDSPKGAIWITDPVWCRNRSHSKLRVKGKNKDLLRHDSRRIPRSNEQRIQNFRKHFWNGKVATIYPANSFRLNERLAIQQGVFLCPGLVTQSFESNWKNLEDSSVPHLAQIVLDTSREDTRDRLWKDILRMGINRSQVYPGLQGYAESLESRLVFKELYQSD